MKRTAIVGIIDENSKKILEKNGIDVVEIDENTEVDKRLSHHTDLSVFADGNVVFVHRSNFRLSKFLTENGFDVRAVNEPFGEKYPFDCPLNAVVIGNVFLCNIDTVSPDVLQYERQMGREVVSTRQGYTKCSTVVVDNASIITEDLSIAACCEKCELDCLVIQKGFVALDGFPYGFIGGAVGSIPGEKIFFNGEITEHPDFLMIDNFLKKKNVEYTILNKNKLTDVGSILIL